VYFWKQNDYVFCNSCKLINYNLFNSRMVSFKVLVRVYFLGCLVPWSDQLHWALRSTERERWKWYLRIHQQDAFLELNKQCTTFQNLKTFWSSCTQLQTILNIKEIWWRTIFAIWISICSKCCLHPATLVQSCRSSCRCT
jgi:hypothetical protein